MKSSLKKITTALLLVFIGTISYAADPNKDLKHLAKWMAGSFSSNKQHLSDTANYFDIRLQIVPIWKERTDGYWFYVEQAVADYLQKPYRQRVYHLTALAEGGFESAVLLINDPLRFANNPQKIASHLTPDSLVLKNGCGVILQKVNGKKFQGGTVGKGCPSDRKGASYATAMVTVMPKELHSWDRGYNENDEQVWGADKAGYIFIKK